MSTALAHATPKSYVSQVEGASQPLASIATSTRLPARRKDRLVTKRSYQIPIDSFLKRRKASVKPVAFQWHCDIIRRSDGARINTVQFGQSKNRTLELAFRKAPLEFNYDCELPNLSSDLKAEYRRTVSIAGRPVVLPKEWMPVQSHTCQLFALEKDSSEFKDLEQQFHETMPDARVTSIQRIQNLLTYQKYYAECLKINADCTSDKPYETEQLLFHGTKNLPPATIISSQEGFDTRLASEQNLWGPGAYFAEDASYADKFAFRSGPTTRQMMVASVAVGSCFDYGTLCNPTLNQPPIDVLNRGRHHSVCGITKDSRVYAVFNSNQCVPRYLIKYSI